MNAASDLKKTKKRGEGEKRINGHDDDNRMKPRPRAAVGVNG